MKITMSTRKPDSKMTVEVSRTGVFTTSIPMTLMSYLDIKIMEGNLRRVAQAEESAQEEASRVAQAEREEREERAQAEASRFAHARLLGQLERELQAIRARQNPVEYARICSILLDAENAWVDATSCAEAEFTNYDEAMAADDLVDITNSAYRVAYSAWMNF